MRNDKSLVDLVNLLVRTKALEDLLLCFAAGQDRRDKALLASCFSKNAELDFEHPAAQFGVVLSPLVGRETVVDTIWQNIEGLDTSHTVTNQRIVILSEASAHGTALVEANHVLRADPSRRLMLKNFYDTDYVSSGSQWQISRVVIRKIWHVGDPTVLFPQ